MKNSNKATLFLNIVFIFAIFSCNRFDEERENVYIPPTVTIDNEVICIIEVTQNRVLGNLMIRDITSNRIVLSLPSLDKRRIIILPLGEYEISADGIRGTVDLQEDSRIVVSGNNFRREPLRQPQPSATIAFRRGNNYVTDNNNIIAGSQYHLTILDIENLLLPTTAYKMEIDGIGSIPLRSAKESNQRIISENPIIFERIGNYKVTVTSSSGTFEFPFRVIEIPPIITINNLWRERPLQFAEMEYFVIDINERINGILINDNVTYTFNDNTYMDRSRRAGLLSSGPNGEPYISTESYGRIVI